MLRALLVEDSPDDAELVQIELRRAGFDLYTERVDTAEAFNAALDNRPWDIVLSDSSMPMFSGMKALELLRARSMDLPFIIVSGTLGEAIAVKVMKAGAHDFFSKGNLVRLGSAVEREVRDAELRREGVVEKRRAEDEVARLLADLRTAVQVRDNFLSIASHELRTPLTALQLNVQSLQRHARLHPERAVPSSALQKQVDVISRQVVRFTTLIDNLLDVSRIVAGEMTLEREPLDLGDLVREAVARCETIIRQSGSEVVVQAETVLGSWDRFRLESVVVNLLSNAIKFGAGAVIEVKVEGDDATARLVVRDHGIGIPPDAQARIFEKFERAVTHRNYGGFGLGLWIARQAVLAHGGNIRCDSAPGAGSTFVVELPRSLDHEG